MSGITSYIQPLGSSLCSQNQDERKIHFILEEAFNIWRWNEQVTNIIKQPFWIENLDDVPDKNIRKSLFFSS